VIFATGYRSRDTLATLGAAGALCARDPGGLPVVRRDHSIELTVPADASVYVQGATEHAFGLTSTLLSMTAVRAGEIAAAIAGARVREPAAAAS
jgi:L-ornithine N5-oxygenase